MGTVHLRFRLLQERASIRDAGEGIRGRLKSELLLQFAAQCLRAFPGGDISNGVDDSQQRAILVEDRG